MRHFMTYEFIHKFMHMKNIVKSYLNSCVPRFQMNTPVHKVFSTDWLLGRSCGRDAGWPGHIPRGHVPL